MRRSRIGRLPLLRQIALSPLNRTQPGLPMKKGRAGTVTHDYKRHGTTTLFAALNTLDGTVIAMCQPQHRHEELLQFLRLIQRKTPKHLHLHLIVDNYGTHTTPTCRPGWPSTRASSCTSRPPARSWLNMVERFFRDISENRIRRDSFTSVPELEVGDRSCIEHHNANPKPFIWTARPTTSPSTGAAKRLSPTSPREIND